MRICLIKVKHCQQEVSIVDAFNITSTDVTLKVLSLTITSRVF